MIESIFTTFDTPIRALYCKLNLNSLLPKRYQSDSAALHDKFRTLKDHLVEQGYSLNGTVCLELGPGNGRTIAYHLLALGAEKVYLVDKYPRQGHDKSLQRIWDQQKYEVAQVHNIDVSAISDNKLELISQDLTQVSIPNESIDFSFSNSVFEHIVDAEGNIKKLSQLMKSNSLMWHDIDMRDHYNFQHPFLFYKYSHKTWRRWLSRPGVSYTNRLRHSDFLNLFDKYSFSPIVINLQTENLPERIHSDFKDYPNDILTISKCQYLLKK